MKDKYLEAADLAEKLERSMRIQAMWKEAYEVGPCKLMVAKGMAPYPSRALEVKRAWLERADGERFDITLDQYKELTN